jgi:CBS-domain-containing membrane protein
LKIIYPSGDAEIVAVMTGPAEAKLEYLVVTMAVVQDSNLHREKG